MAKVNNEEDEERKDLPFLFILGVGASVGLFIYRRRKSVPHIAVIVDNNSHVHRSTDKGATWTDFGVIGAANWFFGHAYLGNGISLIGDAFGHVFLVSDYGLVWDDLGVMTAGQDVNLIINLGSDGVLLVDDENPSHIYYTADVNAPWVDIATVGGRCFAGEYLGNGVVCVGAYGNIYRSVDYGQTWTDLGVITSDEVYCIKSLGNGIALAVGDGEHVYRTTDYGQTWADLGLVASDEIYAIGYLGEGIVVFADRDGHVYRSTDFGLTWSDLGVVIGITNPFAIDYMGDGVVCIGGADGHVYRSVDYGLTWNDLGVIAGPITTLIYMA